MSGESYFLMKLRKDLAKRGVDEDYATEQIAELCSGVESETVTYRRSKATGELVVSTKVVRKTQESRARAAKLTAAIFGYDGVGDVIDMSEDKQLEVAIPQANHNQIVVKK
jgi:hypothetical protein